MTDASEPDTRPVGRYFYVDPSLDEKIRVTAFRRKISQNDLIVEALRNLLENVSTDPVMDFEVDDGC